MKIIIFSILFALPHTSIAETSPCDKRCTFVLTSESGKQDVVINPTRAELRMTTFSTFKIPNTLIAMDTGLISDLNQRLTYDHDLYPTKSWWPEIWSKEPLTIRQAFQYSAVPIYREIARKTGPQLMQQYLKQFNYGNKDISSGIDNFWLNGSMKISALEQTEFLRKLFNQNFGLAKKTISEFKHVMLVEETEQYKLYAKTGGGSLDDNRALGWYVGVVEKDNDYYYFALNLERSTFKDVQSARIDIARSLLKSHDVI